MKRIFLLSMLGLNFAACSVDQVEMDINENEIQELNAVLNTTGCEPTIHNFGEAGSIEVSNDENNLYIKILPEPGFELDNVKLHIANSLVDFPTAGSGSGNLPPGQMHYKVNNPDSEGHTFEFDLVDYPASFYIASQSTFFKDDNSYSVWAGTPADNKGNWAYFEYTVQECEVECTEFLGPDNIGEELTVTGTEGLTDIRGWTFGDFENYVWDTLLEGAPEGGDFNPSLQYIFDNLSSVPYGFHSSTYTVTVGDCQDSIVIGATVICENAGCQSN
ncbi:hypothetical protein [Salinimicrobium sp. TH3]|uniref:hypothetical protein n=1 Tax=Salinimicrobium sp. TH3 TaxID=2997342 RepID=UPI002274F670|nr:hypothetical protein [Salinimicrobium sp. TH3]MCY2685765.1 hypothetical protein [Salinimicrobium sp. TH3]